MRCCCVNGANAIRRKPSNRPDCRICRLPTSAEVHRRDSQIEAGARDEPLRRYTVGDVSDRSGDTGSFEELAMPLFDQLYNFANWLTQNREEAEDLVQETYTKALKGFPSFQLGTNFRAWMYRILRNTFLTSRTGLRATMTVPLDLEQDEPELAIENSTPETILMKRSDSQSVMSAIDD